jgi:hypothetical protein
VCIDEEPKGALNNTMCASLAGSAYCLTDQIVINFNTRLHAGSDAVSLRSQFGLQRILFARYQLEP